ncbi:MAG: DUF2283 domain-containing protein [Deltaproteobacteria bacterium]|nr:DUF2283 domain-containing protein [Deltaproteobacteria bacterium]
MAMREFSISYDKDADVVYLSFGQPAPAVSEEREKGVFARYDPKTDELVGVTIVNFSRRFDALPRVVAVPDHREHV